MKRIHTVAIIGAVMGLPLLAGCPSISNTASSSTTTQTASLAGTVYGGRQPVASSLVYAYESATTAGAVPTQIGAAKTGTNGQFTMSFSPTPATGQIVYLVAVGGNAGGGGTNSAIYLTTVAGAFCTSGCSFPSFVNINELSTVASTAAMHSTMDFVSCSTIPTSTQSGTCLSIPGTSGLAAKAATVNSLVNVSNGQASAFLSAQPTGSAAYTTLEKMNTLANVIAACVNATTSAPTPCTNLFALTLNVTDTLQAAYNIAASPTVSAKTSQIYALLPAQLVYTPTLAAAPSTSSGWTVSGGLFAYVANASSNNLSVYQVSSSVGAMQQISNSPFAAGSGPSSVTIDPSGRFAYVTNATGNDISAYTLDPSTGAPTAVTTGGAAACGGTVSPNPNNCFTTGTSPQSIVVDPSGSFAYALASNGIYGYSINSSTGALTALSPTSTTASISTPVSMNTSPDGKFIYVVNSGNNTVSAYSIDSSTGALTQITGSPFATGDTPKSIAFDPSGSFAYVANSAGNDISAYTVNSSTGALTAITGGSAAACGGTVSPNPNNCFAAGTTPVSITIDPTGSYLYTANSGSNNVSGFAINSSTGELAAISGTPASPFAAGTSPVAVTLDPSGKFAYATNAGSNNVTAYTVDGSTGALVAVSISGSYNTGSSPYQVTESASGRFLYVTNAGSNAVSAYTIDSSTGALTSVAGSACSGVTGVSNCFAAGTTPHGLVDVSDKYLYVANSGSTGTSGITGFTINGNSGALTSLGSYTTGSTPESLAVDSTGSFLYVSNSGSTGTNGVTGYTIGSGGALSTIASYTTQKTPMWLAVDPTDQYLYVPNYGSKSVSGYSINSTTGALSPISSTAGSPFATAAHPFAIAFTSNGSYAYVTYGGGIDGFTFNSATGNLTAMSSSFSAGTSPEGIDAGPNNSFVFSVDNGGNTTNAAWSHAIGSGGALAGTSYAGAASPVDVAVNPTGTIIYVTYNGSNQVWAYKVNSSSGALSLLGLTSPFTAGSGPGAMKFRP